MTTKKQPENSEKLTKVQKYYISGHRDRDLKTLAKDIGASVPIVREYLKHLMKTDEETTKAVEELKVPDVAPNIAPATFRADDTMAKSKRGGAVVMTEGASALGDEFRKTTKMSERLSNCVQKIRPDRPKAL